MFKKENSYFFLILADLHTQDEEMETRFNV
jgi:hypothetical protein